jgi:hypothetical protein
MKNVPDLKESFTAARPTGLDSKTWKSVQLIFAALQRSLRQTGQDRFYGYLIEVYRTYTDWRDNGISAKMARQLAECLDLPLRKGTSPIFRSGRHALLTYLQGLPKKSQIDADDNASLDGYRQTVGTRFKGLIKQKKFNSIFASNAERESVTKWLIANEHVTLAMPSSGSEKMKEQHFWPDGARYRSVEIFWPRTLGKGS